MKAGLLLSRKEQICLGFFQVAMRWSQKESYNVPRTTQNPFLASSAAAAAPKPDVACQYNK